MTSPKKPATTIEPWQVLDTKNSYSDRWLTVRSDTVRVSNGAILSPYHTIEFPEWVCAIALTPEREIVLVEEYRHGIKRLSLEIPCGSPEGENEDEMTAIQRELLEETGYASPEWHFLGSSTANTARQNNSVHAFLALDARKVADQKLDPGEVIRIHVLPWDSSWPVSATAGWRSPPCSSPPSGSSGPSPGRRGTRVCWPSISRLP